MGWESSAEVPFDLGSLLQGQVRVAKLKSAYSLLIIASRGLGCETNLLKIMDLESPDMVGFELGRHLQGQLRITKLKSAYNSLILLLEDWDVKPTCRKP